MHKFMFVAKLVWISFIIALLSTVFGLAAILSLLFVLFGSDIDQIVGFAAIAVLWIFVFVILYSTSDR